MPVFAALRGVLGSLLEVELLGRFRRFVVARFGLCGFRGFPLRLAPIDLGKLALGPLERFLDALPQGFCTAFRMVLAALDLAGRRRGSLAADRVRAGCRVLVDDDFASLR